MVENSDYKFNELCQEQTTYRNRFEIIKYNENTLEESKHLHKNYDKGTSELFATVYAYKHSRLLKNANFIVKVTGRYFVPELEGFLNQHDLDTYDGLTQHNNLVLSRDPRSEIVGSHSTNFSCIFNGTRDTEHFQHIETDYRNRLLKFKNILVCKEFTIEPTVKGGCGSIVTRL